MKIKIILAFFSLLIISEDVKGQVDKTRATNSFVMTAEGNGFMCPFLTPQLINVIEKNMGCKVEKTNKYELLLNCLESKEIQPDQLIDLAEKIGFQRKMIHVSINEIDE